MRALPRRIGPKRIGLFGLFGSGNLGNDGSLEAMLDFLRTALPEAELLCICNNPGKVERHYKIPAIDIGAEVPADTMLGALARLSPARKLLRRLPAVNAVRGLDALIVPGTGILDDFSERFWGMPAALFGWCLAARLSGVRIAFVSVGAGPIAHPLSRWLMKGAARLAHYRSYRDDHSRDFMQSIGFDTRGDAVYPDIAFRLPAPAAAPAAPPQAQGPLTVGLGLMTYIGWRGDWARGATIYGSYVPKIARFALWLLDRGHRVRLLMGDVVDHKAVDDVLKAIAAERPGYPRERVVAEPSHTLHEVMRQMAETDVVVGTRFHNVVCALKVGKPMISIGYARKNDVLLADMGLGDFCQHVERLDVEVLIDQFSRLVSNRAGYEQRIRAKVGEYRRRLSQQEDILLEGVLGGG
ncbi:MAG TPA: polysaccharide pyruvyl transferase family protein, partial [Hyphomicrobiaceae bacterium]|nr:polysaccharide pyruvyl transferase family protein [Hyphomicrobiaceae bacterium]